MSILKTVISAHFHLSLAACQANKTIRELYGFLFYLHIEFLMHLLRPRPPRGSGGPIIKLTMESENFTANEGLQKDLAGDEIKVC